LIAVADTSVILDFFDGEIPDPFLAIQPYRLIKISPVALHEILRTYPEEMHSQLIEELKGELLGPPKLEHWFESAQVLRKLYPRRREKNIAQMQNDILIALAARDIGAPVWSRDSDFGLICDSLGVGLIAH
jgi:predicted nucleic acid-binding protein